MEHVSSKHAEGIEVNHRQLLLSENYNSFIYFKNAPRHLLWTQRHANRLGLQQ